MSEYSESFKDPQWQKKRLEIMDRDAFVCVLCCDDKSTLNVHHLWYEKGKNPWEYPNRCYITLCEDCHKAEHERNDEIKGTSLLGLKKAGLPSAFIIDLLASLNDFSTREQGVFYTELDVLNTIISRVALRKIPFGDLVDFCNKYNENRGSI